MISVHERLTEINKRVDSIIDDIWVKAELNYKKLEAEYNNKSASSRENGEVLRCSTLNGYNELF